MLRELPNDQEVDGIFIPESKTSRYMSMEVVAVGDGRLRATDLVIQRRMCVQPGDRVFVQVSTMMLASNMQKINDEKFLVLNHHDVIAKIDAGVNSLTLDSFHPVGRWVVARVLQPQRVGKIWLPGNTEPLQSAGEVKTFLEKAGALAMTELGDPPVGTRLMLEHTRVNPIKLGKVMCVYVDVQNVAGATPELYDPATAAAEEDPTKIVTS